MKKDTKKNIKTWILFSFVACLLIIPLTFNLSPILKTISGGIIIGYFAGVLHESKNTKK